MNDELRRKAVIRKATYFGVILALFVVSMFWRGVFKLPIGNPENAVTRDETTGKLVELSTADRVSRLPIAYQAEDLELRERDAGDPEVGGALAQVSLVGVRGFIVTSLWNATITAQKRGEYHEMERKAMLLTKLQPHFITPWVFQAWNISYNVSVETDKLGDQYYYIARGISLLAEGDRANTRTHRRGDKVYMVGSPDIRYQLGFYAQNKFSVSDKVATLYSLSQLSLIPPSDRDPQRFRKNPTDPVDPDQFQEFCERNPQLVRRLKTKLNMKSPEQVVDFLAVNWRIPSRYDVDTKLPYKEDRAFPTLPQADDGADIALADYLAELRRQLDVKSAGGPDSIDIRMVARAWFEHALSVCPPPKEGVPSMTPQKDEYDRFRYRIPERPALIVVRFSPARAQNYVAERLQKEGWFDDRTKWNPDAYFDRDSLWFSPLGDGESLRSQLKALGLPSDSIAKLIQLETPPKLEGELNGRAGTRIDPAFRGRVKVRWSPLKPATALDAPPSDPTGVDVEHEEVGLEERGPDGKRIRPENEVWLKRIRFSPGTNALAEWGKAHRLWEVFGRKNGLNPADRFRQEQLAKTAEFAGVVPDREYTDQQLATMKLTRDHLAAAKAILYYDQNRQITQYQKFLDESLAERSSDLAASRQLMWNADALHLRDPDGTAELATRIKAAALWRKVFADEKHSPFYNSDRAETLHENTLAQEQIVAELLRQQAKVALADLRRRVTDELALVSPALLTQPNVINKLVADAATTPDEKLGIRLQVADGMVALSPVLVTAGEAGLSNAILTDEAQARIALAFAAFDPNGAFAKRVREVHASWKQILPPSKQASEDDVARYLLATEASWMKQYADPARSIEWVKYSIRLSRMIRQGEVAVPESPQIPPGAPQPRVMPAPPTDAPPGR